MDQNNNRVKIHERVARLEENYKNIDDRLDCIEKKLDKVRLQIENWRGKFGLLAALGGLIGGGIISLVIRLLI